MRGISFPVSVTPHGRFPIPGLSGSKALGTGSGGRKARPFRRKPLERRSGEPVSHGGGFPPAAEKRVLSRPVHEIEGDFSTPPPPRGVGGREPSPSQRRESSSRATVAVSLSPCSFSWEPFLSCSFGEVTSLPGNHDRTGSLTPITGAPPRRHPKRTAPAFP